MRSFHLPGRSPVLACHAMCATSHPMASLTAIETLKAGGNAVDAAIAAAAILAVVEPHMTGIGGDCFAMLARPGQRPVALSAAGRAPRAATAQWYAQAGISALTATSPHAVTVPGAIDGWARLLADHGTMTLARVLAPAIETAEQGFAVPPRIAWDWARLKGKIEGHAGARLHLLIDGKPPRAGDRMRFPALARTLRTIARDGRDGFYEGEVAADMVSELKALGGLHTLEDFAQQSSTYVEPISVPYGGLDVLELPPSSQGIVALMLLRMLARSGARHGDADCAERHHFMMEAGRLAYAMRDAFVADPDMAEVPVDHMLADATIDTLLSRLDPAKRVKDLGPMPPPPGTLTGGSDTVYLTVVDSSGLAISFINSLFAQFGSGIVTANTGITLHNRGQGFVLDPGHPNCIAPGKRPLSTLVPAMALKDGRPKLAFGVMGGAFQPMGHAYVISNIVDYRLDPQEAIDLARVFFEGDTLAAEHGMSAATVAGLQALGHTVTRPDAPWGGGQLVAIDHTTGVLTGASDPRKDGCALGY